MENDHNIENFLSEVIQRASNAHQTIVGHGMQTNKLQLGKSEKDARVKDIADRYLKKEPVEIDEAASKLGITNKDIAKELSLREARKILGKE